jgi:hypothetical protein
MLRDIVVILALIIIMDFLIVMNAIVMREVHPVWFVTRLMAHAHVILNISLVPIVTDALTDGGILIIFLVKNVVVMKMDPPL